MQQLEGRSSLLLDSTCSFLRCDEELLERSTWRLAKLNTCESGMLKKTMSPLFSYIDGTLNIEV
jgi:hypothetical protein